MLHRVVGIGTCSGTDTDKFAKFRLTTVTAKVVKAPLIKECLANVECKVIDIVAKHNNIMLEGVAAVPVCRSGFRRAPTSLEIDKPPQADNQSEVLSRYVAVSNPTQPSGVLPSIQSKDCRVRYA